MNLSKILEPLSWDLYMLHASTENHIRLMHEAYISPMIMVANILLKFIFIFIKMMVNYNVYRHTVPLFHFHI